MRLHFIAIGGSIMHSLAIALSKAGHRVSGSDDEIYEPSRSRLEEQGILPASNGWDAHKITPDLDIVVLGMHARKDNPELLAAMEQGLRIESFPELIYEFSKNKKRIVVTGSHGKTTTSGMIAHVLDQVGVPADRMIGARIGALEPVSLSDAGIIVLEGDEYLSSPLDPRPKFLHYHPDIVIITGIAWDHMNVFPTYASYIAPFRELISSLNPSATLIYCKEDADLQKLVEEVKPKCNLIPYHAFPYEIHDQNFHLRKQDGSLFPLKIFGRHNMLNLQAAALACQSLGIGEDAFVEAIRSFTGADKRLQLLCAEDGFTAYLDFAHAPSKVKATVEAVREKHPGATIIAALELHTFSSLNPDFLPLYKDVLVDADQKIVYFSPHTLAIKRLPDLSPEQLADYFNEPNLIIVQSGDELAQTIQLAKAKCPVVMLWMSSGRFDGVELTTIRPTLNKS